MGKDDQNPNTFRDFSSTKIRFLKSFKAFQKYWGGVKAVWKKSKCKHIFSRDGFPNTQLDMRDIPFNGRTSQLLSKII